MNQGLNSTKLWYQPTFVYDKIMAEVRSLIHQEAENSALTASIFIKNSDIVEDTISIEMF